MLRLPCWVVLVAGALVGCGGPPEGPDAGDAQTICAADTDCDDAIFCNGAELCRPIAAGADARGCIAALEDRCLAGQVCRETESECVTDCATTEDADGDGVTAPACGGTDCDDSDPLRYPGNTEICDEGNHDEDCDDTTYGERNGDRDGADDLRCCNVRADDPTMLNCGEDCDDLRRGVHPDATEACDRFDNDCDGAIDEGGVQAMVWPDLDRDGVGAGTPVSVCADSVGFATSGDDCDDGDPAQRPGGPEICDARDNDCDGTVDENATAVTWYRDADGDGFGSAHTGTVTSCVPLTGFSLLGNDCDDTRIGVSPVANELCNGVDDDCNGVADFEVGPGDFEDDDADGFVDSGCGTAGDDCDDTSAATHPGATELCDGRDNDCDGTQDDLTGMVAWYVDVDGDGWGDGSRPPITSCTEPAGRVTRALDCDDSDPDRSPGRADLCDGIDADCDMDVDEDAVLTLYWMDDRDGDGYAGGAPISSCTPVAGATTIGGDCDDDRADLRPTATESCDGEDDDCDGATDESLGTISCGMASCRVEIAACTGGTTNVCVPGAGAPDVCNGADDDCDGVADDEPSATMSCSLANAVDQCQAGACAVVACELGFDDCNAADGDGCEAELATDEAHCGKCGGACPPGDTCVEGACSSEVVQIELGGRHTCVRLGGGSVYCWGANELGQLGADSFATLWTRPLRLAIGGSPATPISDASELDTAVDSGCVLRRGSIQPLCWGDTIGTGFGGGLPFFAVGLENPPIAETPVDVEFGGRFHMILDAVGHLWFGGDNANGVGAAASSGGTLLAYQESARAGTSAISQITCGIRHCIAREASSATASLTWGSNYEEELGTLVSSGGSSTARPAPLGAWTNAAVGEHHTCIVRPGGAVECVGRNDRGQIGNGGTAVANALVANGARAEVGIDSHRDTTCSIDAMGRVWCWGANDFGQCGVSGPDVVMPRQVDLDGVRARLIAVGDRHACAVLATNQVACWGQNVFGQLGNGTTTSSATRVFVSGLP